MLRQKYLTFKIPLLILAIVVCFSMNPFLSAVHATEKAGFSFSHAVGYNFLNMEDVGHCPACPSDNHPDAEHGHFGCEFHLAGFLCMHAEYCQPHLLETSLLVFEPSRTPPKVYLERFIPPRIIFLKLQRRFSNFN
ncbi:MAG: hypothetical protein FD159_2655 [Syntrophaceae bacterium]|nr:MAG: hypothetical protein FD159_2655 [Syntrophaceae bacterium]